MPEWLIPILTFLTGGLGGYIGASRKVVVMEVKLEELERWRQKTATMLAVHNEDILIHDVEIQAIMNKVSLPRARRQVIRESDL